MAPPPPDSSVESSPAAGVDAIVSCIVTFEPGFDGHECLEELIAILVRSEIRVREARLHFTSLEDVFRQLTGAAVASDMPGVAPS